MIYFAIVSRLSDKLLFTSSVDDNPVATNFTPLVRNFLKDYSNRNRTALSMPMQDQLFHISVSPPIISACVTTPDLRKEALDFLAEVNITFLSKYSQQEIDGASKEYCFIDFHKEIEDIRSKYIRNIQYNNMQLLQQDLNNVHQTMANNVKSALVTGEKLGDVERLSQDLSNSAGMFQKNSTDLNRMHLWRTYGRPTVVILIVSIIYYIATFI
ncbi:Vesicle-trafficking protein S22b [Tritrichomonas musculus]|uniref:Vesicle-trafficking protein S22b n=1 Tax=Tritrichomonas musculus TaxID=1915356 RepID=A0ABR2K002_9EUKA